MLDEAAFAPLLRGDLDTVSFVRDYVEVRIEYNVLRCMTGPIVSSEEGSVRFPQPGSRDALCGLIDCRVIEVEISKKAIELRMDSGQTLILPIDDASKRLPDGRVIEAVHLIPADERGDLDVTKMVIW